VPFIIINQTRFPAHFSRVYAHHAELFAIMLDDQKLVNKLREKNRVNMKMSDEEMQLLMRN
jgi:hypothetical protein